MIALALADIHTALGARLAELDGRQMVADYGDPLAEARAVRTTGGIVDRGYRATIRVAGPDRVELLQSMTTNDVIKQATSSALPNAICTNHGKVQSLFTGLKEEEFFLLDMDPAVGEFTRGFLDKYTIIRDATTEDVSVATGRVGVYGPQARQVVAQATGIADLPEAAGEVVRMADGGWIWPTVDLAGAGLELLLPAEGLESLWRSLLEAGQALEVGPVGFEALEILRMEAGRPRFGVEVDDNVILLEAGLTDTVAFDKGCFIGQETLSRIIFRGAVNKQLLGLLLDGDPPAPETPVMDGDKQVGTIKSACYSPNLDKVIALAYMRRGHMEAGTEVTVNGTAIVAIPPFYPAG